MKEKEDKKSKISIVGVLIIILLISTVGAVAIPKYNNYVKLQKEKMALNYAAVVAQAAGAYYSQSQVTPAYADLGAYGPSGFIAILNGVSVQVSGDGSAGYVSPTDFDAQSVLWKK